MLWTVATPLICPAKACCPLHHAPHIPGSQRPLASSLRGPQPLPWPGTPSFPGRLTSAIPQPPSHPLRSRYLRPPLNLRTLDPKLEASKAPRCLLEVAGSWAGLQAPHTRPLKPSPEIWFALGSLSVPAVTGEGLGLAPSPPGTPTLAGIPLLIPDLGGGSAGGSRCTPRPAILARTAPVVEDAQGLAGGSLEVGPGLPWQPPGSPLVAGSSLGGQQTLWGARSAGLLSWMPLPWQGPGSQRRGALRVTGLVGAVRGGRTRDSVHRQPAGPEAGTGLTGGGARAGHRALHCLGLRSAALVEGGEAEGEGAMGAEEMGGQEEEKLRVGGTGRGLRGTRGNGQLSTLRL